MHHIKCNADSRKSSVAAYTTAPASAANHAWTITFCPKFFTLDYVNNIIEKKVFANNALINEFQSYEHVLTHEFMHVDKIGHANHISDLSSSILPSNAGQLVPVYGASRCKDFARLRVPQGDDPHSYNTRARINPEVVLNADNFAWYATANYIKQKLGRAPLVPRDLAHVATDAAVNAVVAIADQLAAPALSRLPPDIIYDDEDVDGSANITADPNWDESLPWPENCKLPDENGDMDCTYLGETYAEFVANPRGPLVTEIPDTLIAGTVTTPPPSPTAIPDSGVKPTAKPSCSSDKVTASGASKVKQELADKAHDQCCNDGEDGRTPIATQDEEVAFIGDLNDSCIACDDAAAYVQAIIDACVTPSGTGGQVDVNGPGSISIELQPL